MKPRGHSQPLLYLDFDGILHPKSCHWGVGGPYLEAEGHSLFEHARLLQVILGEYPAVRLVLNSSWVEMLGVNAALSHLPQALQRRVIGTTLELLTSRPPLPKLLPAERVLFDVQARKPSAWAALDSDVQGWPEQLLQHVVRTSPEDGIGPVAVQGALHSKLLVISADTPAR